MHKYENCIVKCENKVALRKLYNKLTELGIEEFNSELYTGTEYDYDRIDGIFSNIEYDPDKEIWILIEYQDYSIGPFPKGYAFYFRHNKELDGKIGKNKFQDWSTFEEIPYHTFFRKDKFNELLK